METGERETGDLMQSKRPTTAPPAPGDRPLAAGGRIRSGGALWRWARANTFTPPWLPPRWRHPFVGYVGAVLLQGVAVAVVVLLAKVLIGFAFPSLLATLVVALLALTWGVGPSLLGALAGATFLAGVLLSPVLHVQETALGRGVALGLYGAVGVALTALASRVVRARHDAHDRAHREAEEAARLGATIEAMADGVVVFDRDERVQHANAALRAVLARDDHPADAVWFVHARDALLTPRDADGQPLPPERSPLRRVLRGDVLTGPDVADLRVRAPDGRERVVSVSGAPIRDPEGRTIGGVLAVRDVTERRRLEREVAAQAAQLDATFAALADGVAAFAADGRLLRANAALRALCGLDARPDAFARALGERADLFATRDAHGRSLPPAAWPLARVLAGEELTPPLEVWVQALDGREIAVSVSGAPLRDTAGALIGAVLGVRDVTERRRLERTVADERARLREMFAHVPASIALLTGPDHVFAFANAPYERLAGRGALAGRAARDVFPDLAGQGFVERLDHVSRTGEPFVATEQGVRTARDGAVEETFWTVAYQPLRAAADAPEGILVHAVEVTAQVRARRHADELAMARDRARAEFVATVSHDLQQPLTALRAGLGFVQTALGGRLAPDEAALLDNARQNTERLRAQVADLLTANQIEAGALSLDRAPLDLRAVVERALGAVRPQLREKEQTLEVDLPVPLPVAGDARRLEQVVVNLLSNAHRHTPPGARVALTGWVTGAEVGLTVRDDGPGVPAAAREAIFGRFYRADPAAGGSGLGLSVVRAIVELHGGRVWATGAEDAEGGGAAFHVALPRDPAAGGGGTG